MLQALTACAHKGCVAASDLGSEEMITLPGAGNAGIEVGEVNGIVERRHPRNPYSKVQRQFLSGSERIRRVTVVMSGLAIDVPGWSVGDVGVVGNSKQEVGKIIVGVLAVKEKVSVVVGR